MKKDIRFLKKIRCRIEALPWSVWENEDTKDQSQYDKKKIKGRSYAYSKPYKRLCFSSIWRR